MAGGGPAGRMGSGSARSRRRLVGEINVVPYIDVMLVLLVIFRPQGIFGNKKELTFVK